MARSNLPFRVECKSLYPFYEAIAAFDSDRVAFGYARDCAETNPDFEYRVVRGRKVLADADACRHGVA